MPICSFDEGSKAVWSPVGILKFHEFYNFCIQFNTIRNGAFPWKQNVLHFALILFIFMYISSNLSDPALQPHSLNMIILTLTTPRGSFPAPGFHKALDFHPCAGKVFDLSSNELWYRMYSFICTHKYTFPGFCIGFFGPDDIPWLKPFLRVHLLLSTQGGSFKSRNNLLFYCIKYFTSIVLQY